MPDTIYYNPNGNNSVFDSLPADVKQLVHQVQADDSSTQNNDSPAGFLMVLLGIYLFAYLLIKLSKFIDGDREEAFSIFKQNGNSRTPVPDDVPAVETVPAGEPEDKDYYIYDGNNLGLSETEITNILVKYYPFYNTLWPTVQYRFQQRLLNFIKSKRFIIYSKQPYKEMPVLTSAAAIHLTLGMDEFMLPWFKNISVHPEAYFAEDSLRVLAGNVEGETVTIAWDQLLKGINNQTDGSNVGLHEMAHALYYQQAIADNNKEVNFSSYFEKVMHEGEEVYKLKDDQKILYSDYAYRNLQEFWAESVEIFFEKPEAMKMCYPQIYETIKELLKQDPVNKGNPLC